MNPSVTAVIPVHNHVAWCEGAVDSIASQGYSPLRIIVVDDGSTDGSAEKILAGVKELSFHPNPGGLDQYTGRWKDTGVGICLCRLPKAHGPSFARNIGLKVGWEGTELFALLDSDDLYKPGKIQKSIEVWQRANGAVGVVYSDYDTLCATTGVLLRQHKEPYGRERLLRECLPNCDSIISREAFERCGMFREDLRTVEDYDRWLSISERFILSHIPESLLVIRVGEHSSSSRVPTAIWQDCYRRVMEGVAARRC